MRNFPHTVFLLLLVFINNVSADNILVLNTTGNEPLNSSNQNGFMDIVTKEALKRIGYKLKTLQLPAERGLKNANAGIEDGEMSRVAGLSKTYPNLIQVPEKIMDWEFVVFSEKKISLSRSWHNLSYKQVSFLNGWKILEANVPTNASIVKVNKPSQLFSLLKKKRTDYIIYEKWGGLLLLKTQKLKNISLLKPALAKKEMFIYLHKKHRHLVIKLSSALKQMKSDGSYQKIFNLILKPLIK